MLSAIYAERHLCLVSFMLSVIYAECHLSCVPFMLSVIHAECHYIEWRNADSRGAIVGFDDKKILFILIGIEH
jgi:hypothetical protein